MENVKRYFIIYNMTKLFADMRFLFCHKRKQNIYLWEQDGVKNIKMLGRVKGDVWGTNDLNDWQKVPATALLMSVGGLEVETHLFTNNCRLVATGPGCEGWESFGEIKRMCRRGSQADEDKMPKRKTTSIWCAQAGSPCVLFLCNTDSGSLLSSAPLPSTLHRTWQVTPSYHLLPFFLPFTIQVDVISRFVCVLLLRYLFVPPQRAKYYSHALVPMASPSPLSAPVVSMLLLC